MDLLIRRLVSEVKSTNAFQRLLYNTLDFDFISEALLPEQYQNSDSGFAVGEMNYDVVLVPACLTLRSTTLNALKKFRAKGGNVIFMGNLPTMVDAIDSEEVKLFADECTKIDWDKCSLLNVMKPYRNVEIANFAGAPSNNLMYGMRHDGDAKNLFICHVQNSFRKSSNPMEKYYVTIKGEYRPFAMDTFTGERKEMPAEYVAGNTVIKWYCYAHSSLLLRLEKGKSEATDIPGPKAISEEYMSGAAKLILHEPNVCVLDMAKWKLDYGEWTKKEEMLRICDMAKTKLGLSTAATHGAQPWAVKFDEPKNTITLEVSVNSDIEIDNAILALEDFDVTDIEFNGRKIEKKPLGYYVDFSITKVNIGKIEKGVNTLVVTKPFNVVSCIENMFILGDFGVEILGDTVKIIKSKDEIYFGDWTKQGLSFYGGTATYRYNIKGGYNAKLALGLYLAPCVTVELDGKRVGNVSLAPNTVDLGQLSDEEHILDITVHASRINTFGALHLSKYNLGWIGPNAWHTSGAEWSYEYKIAETGLLTAPRIIKY